MPKSCDSRIYGADDNDFAASIAADALRPPDASQYSGAAVDETMRSKSGADDATTKPGMSGGGKSPKSVKVVSDSGDSRASVKGNHGEQS